MNIHDLNGDISDVNINGVDAIELWIGYDTVTLQAGEKVPLYIGAAWGGGDFEMDITLYNGITQRTFTVKCKM